MRLLAQFDVHPMADALQASSTISPIDPKLLELPVMRLPNRSAGYFLCPEKVFPTYFQ